jgi:hypothetical protein
MKWSSKNILTCSSDWPKEWPFGVQSSSTNVIAGLKHFNGGKLYSSHLEEDGCNSMWIDTHLLEMKVEATFGTKDDLVSSHIQDVLTMNPKI